MHSRIRIWQSATMCSATVATSCRSTERELDRRESGQWG